MRLSRDDGNDSESNSIGNQRDMLHRYMQSANLDLFDEYVDDGCTGTNFERPSFKRMLKDIENGKVGVLLVKDLSRLGRNNAVVAMYTQMYFPEHDIRFIAINDGIDTANGDDEMMPFRSVINEYYARDISLKVRSVKRNSALKGEMQCSIAPYGYVKGGKKLEIDPATAEVVKEIFGMIEVGSSMYAVAQALSRRNMPTISEQRKAIVNPSCKWSVQQISYILRNRAYIGDTVGQKYKRKSFKIKKMAKTSEDEWIIIHNTHEAIISSEQFQRVQICLKENPRCGRRSAKVLPIFSGILVCHDCGKRLTCFIDGDRHYYCCSGHTDMHYIGEDRPCTPHYIRDDKLAAAALTEIKRVIGEFNPEDYKRPAKMLQEAQKQIDRLHRRDEEMQAITKRMIEQNAKGILDDDMFKEMVKEYRTERLANERTIHDCEKVITTDPAENARQFAELIKGRSALSELTRDDVLSLLDKLVIHESLSGVRKRKGRTQLVEFHFKYIGVAGEAVVVA
jgi:DNA invertase Pin-like site-specific DNA recombinase